MLTLLQQVIQVIYWFQMIKNEPQLFKTCTKMYVPYITHVDDIFIEEVDKMDMIMSIYNLI